MGSLPRRQRVGAYAVILRERGGLVEVLLSRLAPRVSRTELWTLPGGGVDHGEDPRDALVARDGRSSSTCASHSSSWRGRSSSRSAQRRARKKLIFTQPTRFSTAPFCSGLLGVHSSIVKP